MKGVNAATLAAWIRDAQGATCLLGVGYAERRNIVVIHRGLPRVFGRARVKISGRNGISNSSRAHPCVSKRLPRTVKTWRAVGQSCWAGCSKKTRKRGTEFFEIRGFVRSQDNALCRVIVALFASTSRPHSVVYGSRGGTSLAGARRCLLRAVGGFSNASLSSR